MAPRLLLLVTPEQGGPDVLTAQKQLRAGGFNPGPLDSVYGPATESAVRKFQRAAGLEVDGIVGPKTRAALEAGKVKAPPAGHPPTPGPTLPGREPPGVLALHWMLERLGEKEDPPDSNNVTTTREFRVGRVPWCMEDVSLGFKHGAGMILGDQQPAPQGFWPGRGFAYVPYFEAWAKTRGFWRGLTAPEPGWVACYGFGKSTPVHCGIVRAYLGGGTFEAAEGNTRVGRDSDGGERMLRRRYLTQVVGFAHVEWHAPSKR